MSDFPFAGIIDVNVLPAIPAFSKTDVVAVSYKNIYLTQNCIQIRQLFVEKKLDPAHDDFGTLGYWNNQYFLYNGHHRAVKDAIRGSLKGYFYVHNFDEGHK